MFEVSFPELLVIFVVALVVLGPTRLPGLVTKIGRWVGKARTMARQFREQLENEVNLEELNRMTEAQTRASRTPPPPAGFNGEPLPADPAPVEPGIADTPVPDPNEDIYSHAHDAGGAPMPDVFAPDPDAPPPAPTADPAHAAETEELPTIAPLDEPINR